jgi:hypothetical protein
MKRASPLTEESRSNSRAWPFLAAAIALSALGLGAFIYLFLRELTVFLLILAPVIFAIYQLPAAALYRIYRKKR